MSDPEFDALLRTALQEALDDEYAQAEEWLETQGITPSPEYEAAMAEMLADPNGYLRRWKRRGRRRRTLQIALVAALTAAAIIIGACALFPALRGWVQEVYETKITYWLTGKEQGKYTAETLPDDIRPEHMSEGYEEASCKAFGGVVDVTYRNQDGQRIKFKYMSIEEGGWLSTSFEQDDMQEITHDGIQVFVSEESENGERDNHVMWINENMSVAFKVSGPVSLDELFAIMDSVPTEF